VEQELATLSYVDGEHHCAVRRTLYNASTEPVSRYLIHVTVDRFPGEPERSSQYHRAHPLRLDELDLSATARSVHDESLWERMDLRVKHDRDAYKEIWLLLENENRRFPLYPGQRVIIDYAYRVAAELSGPGLARAVRLPTRQLTVRLDLPESLMPAVWGVETSLSAEEVPLRTPIESSVAGDRIIYEWTVDGPPLNARYSLRWKFRAGSDLVDGVVADTDRRHL